MLAGLAAPWAEQEDGMCSHDTGEEVLHCVQLGLGVPRHVEGRLQLGLHVLDALPALSVNGKFTLTGFRDHGLHLFRRLLDVGDVGLPKQGAGVAGRALGEDGLVARRALVAQDAHHAGPTPALARVHVTRWPQGALHVAVAVWGTQRHSQQ